MIIGLENNDTSFFTVESDDITLDTQDFERNLISLSITERMDAIPQGRLRFYDPKHFYSRILRTGAKLFLSWGYRTEFNQLQSIVPNALNSDEVSGSLIRRGLVGFVSSPSGGGSENGVVTYDCNFTSYEFRGLDQSRYFTSGTKRDVISTIFDELGVGTRRYIDFARGSEKVTTEASVRQDETAYRFLSRLAREWRTLFQFSYTQDGSIAAIFIDPDKIGKVPFAQWTLGARGFSHAIGYRGKLNNVISYSWESNESESGVGQNVQIEIVDGKPIFRRYVAEQETVTSYRLVPERIEEAFESVDGVEAQTKLVKELLSKKDFDQIEHFFDPIESTTAPQGFGYRIKAKMLGNPLFVPPNLVKIYNGFPDRLGNSKTKFYLDEVTHTIDRSGYKMNITIVDVFSLSDIGEALL